MDPAHTHAVGPCFHSVRRYRLELGVSQLWTQLQAVDEYQTWWPSLRKFQSARLDVGEMWHCEIQPNVPLVPRLLRFTIDFVTVVPEALIEAAITGDVVGSASLELAELRDRGSVATDLRLESSLIPKSRALRFTAGISHRLAARGHAIVLDRAARQFTEHVDRGASGT